MIQSKLEGMVSTWPVIVKRASGKCRILHVACWMSIRTKSQKLFKNKIQALFESSLALDSHAPADEQCSDRSKHQSHNRKSHITSTIVVIMECIMLVWSLNLLLYTSFQLKGLALTNSDNYRTFTVHVSPLSRTKDLKGHWRKCRTPSCNYVQVKR